MIGLLPFYRLIIDLPPESVKDQRDVSMFSISVSWRETRGADLHVITGNPMMHHSQAGVKGRPAC